MSDFYMLNDTIIRLASIRDAALSERENRIYISFRDGDRRTSVFLYKSCEDAKRAFTDLCDTLLKHKEGWIPIS